MFERWTYRLPKYSYAGKYYTKAKCWRGLVELYRQSNGYMNWSNVHLEGALHLLIFCYVNHHVCVCVNWKNFYWTRKCMANDPRKVSKWQPRWNLYTTIAINIFSLLDWTHGNFFFLYSVRVGGNRDLGRENETCNPCFKMSFSFIVLFLRWW